MQMVVETDVAVEASDGIVLRANVYRPDADGRFPVILSMGIYGKDAHFGDAFRPQWETLLKIHPGLCGEGSDSSGRYLRWENVDPERWVPDGYVVVAVDSRGSGKSPGYLDPFSPRETQDHADSIAWAAAQPWSNGNVGLLSVSYFAIKQWQVAALRPPALKAIAPWEGGSDLYRDWSHHGGIFSSQFPAAWWPRQVLSNQHGNGASPYRDRDTGERTTGPELSDALLAGNRADHPEDLRRHPLDDAWYRERSPDLGRIDVPLLSAGNWGGQGLHLRGNIEGFVRAGSTQKWLFMHVGTHFESFYLPDYIAVQKRFFDHYLKGENNRWREEPQVQLEIRHPDRTERRGEHEWPLARTQWTKFYLDAVAGAMSRDKPAARAATEYDALGEGVSFSTAPFDQDIEITGPVAARLWISSSSTDMDIFATLRAFAPDGTEVIFTGASELTHVTAGWLRASQRKLDTERSLPYRPYLAHDEIQKLVPRRPYPVDVELWPTSMVYPAGYRLVLTIAGRDIDIPGYARRILHDHADRLGSAEFTARNTVHTGADYDSHLLLPVIPAR
jgi:predicted acyl esterase